MHANHRKNPAARGLPYLTPAAAALTTLLGLIVLIEWTTNSLRIARINPELIPMAPSTALCFILLGAVLLWRPWRPGNRIVRQVWRALAGIVLIYNAVLLLQFALVSISGLPLDIEQWIAPTLLAEQSFIVGRMSPLTALLFILLSFATLFSLPIRDVDHARYRVAQSAATVVLILASILVIGYWYGAPLLYGGTVTPVAFPTAIGFILLSAGLLFDGAPAWLSRWATNPSVSARFTRLVIPGTMAIILVADWSHLAVLDHLPPVYRALSTSLVTLSIGGLVALLTIVVARRTQTAVTRAEQALRESEERFRVIASNTPDHILMQDSQLRYSLVVNPQLGLTEQDMLGKTDYDFLPKEEADKLTQVKRQVLETGAPLHFETSLLSLAGETIFFDGTYVSQFDTQGKVDGLIGYFRNVTERKRAEEALQQSELKYRRLHETMTDAFTLVDMAGHILECNRTYREMLGYTESELGRLTYLDVTPEKWHALESRIVQEQILPHDFSGVYEKEYRRKDGTVFPVELRVSLIRDDAGQPAAMSAIVRDITERKQAEEALQQSERMLKNAEATAHLGYYQIDVRTGKAVWSGETFRIFGLDPSSDEPTVKTYQTLIHPDDAATLFQHFDESIKDQTPFDLIYRIVHSSGEIRYVHSIGKVETNPAGTVVKMFGTLQDITERKRAEEEIRRYSKNLESLYHASLAFAQSLNLVGIGKEVIQSLESILNWKRGSLWVIGEAGRLELLAHSEQGLTGEASQAEFTRVRSLVTRLGDGITGWVALYGKPVRCGDIRNDPRYIQADPRIQSEMCAPLQIQGRTIGALNVESELADAFAQADENLLTILASQAAIAVENARLLESERAARAQLQDLSRRTAEAQENERRAIARELHDEIGQVLTAVKTNLETIQLAPEPATLHQHLAESANVVDRALEQIRTLALNLRPSLLDDFGLVSTLEWYLDRQARSTRIKIDFHSDLGEMRFPTPIETTCFRVLQAAVTNVVRHARATHVAVTLRRTLQGARALELVVRDNGVGFDVAAALERARRESRFARHARARPTGGRTNRD